MPRCLICKHSEYRVLLLQISLKFAEGTESALSASKFTACTCLRWGGCPASSGPRLRRWVSCLLWPKATTVGVLPPLAQGYEHAERWVSCLLWPKATSMPNGGCPASSGPRLRACRTASIRQQSSGIEMTQISHSHQPTLLLVSSPSQQSTMKVREDPLCSYRQDKPKPTKTATTAASAASNKPPRISLSWRGFEEALKTMVRGAVATEGSLYSVYAYDVREDRWSA